MNLIPWLAAAITLLLGPAMFSILGRHGKRPWFPVGVLDKYGGIILLPVFNALAVHFGLLDVIFADMQLSLIAFVASYIPTRVFIIWRKDFAKHDDWSRPCRGKFNAGGWYRVAFIICQLYVVIITMMFFYDKWLLWITLMAFITLVLFRREELNGQTQRITRYPE